MNNFHKFLQRFLIAAFAIIFVFVGTYVPQTWNKVEYAEAGGLGGGYTSFQGAVAFVQQQGSNIAATASRAYNAVTSFATNQGWIKDGTLDGLAWALAKSILSQMSSSMVRWINSGFQGSPNFVQDLQGFLTQAADNAIGEYLQQLDGPLSFICSPFRLDVRVALATTYVRAREGQPAASSCTLTGALANIEDFTGGDFTQGGWESWFSITSKPETYTPYGSVLTAQTQGGARILNAKGQETKLLDFGGGFLSTKLCEVVGGASGPRENCSITTPGKVVQDALTFNLETGPESLIAADEFNEIIGALFAQLGNQAVTGAAGLLGLTGGGSTGISASGSYVNNLANTGGVNTSRIGTLISTGLATENRYQAAALAARVRLTAYVSNITVAAERRNAAQVELNNINSLLVQISGNIGQLNNLQADFNALPANPTAQQTQPILEDYSILRIHTDAEVDASILGWNNIVS